jgi:DNA-binding response OmpR family regulator
MLFEKRPRTVRNILIVEDEPLVAFDNEHLLTTLGYVVIGTVDSAQDAVAAIARGGIDLILSDVRLRDSNGRDVAMAARPAAVPVLFVTATCPIDAPSLVLGCLAKPYSQADLKRAIEAVDAHLAGEKPKRMPRGLTLYS